MDLPDVGDLELLETAEGVEFYNDGNSVIISSESIREGEDGVKITYNALVNAIGELEDSYQTEDHETE